MDLYYMGHSGMLLRGENLSVLMDYYLDAPEGHAGLEGGHMDDAALALPGPLYVLVSHSHGDHLNPVVFSYRSRREDVRYILAKEARRKTPATLRDQVAFLKKGETYADDRLRVTAFGSTDAGVSFYLEVDGKRIFHSGDLNDWHWNREVPARESAGYTAAYLAELADIKSRVSYLDLAMFPVDGRLGPDAFRGGEAFLKAVPTALFAPMHFGPDYAAQDALIRRGPFGDTRIIRWDHRGQRVEF